MRSSARKDDETKIEELEAKIRKLEADQVLFDVERKIRESFTQGVMLVRKSDYVIVYTDTIMDTLFGYDHGELIGKPIYVLKAPGVCSAEELGHEVNQQLKSTGSWKGVVNNTRKDGSLFWCRVSISSFKHNEHGKSWICIHEDISHFVKIEQDLVTYQTKLKDLVSEKTKQLSITNKKLKEEIAARDLVETELRLREQTVRAMSEKSPDPIIRLDADLRYIYVNPAFETFIEIPQERIIGKTATEIDPELKTLSTLQSHAEKVLTSGVSRTTDIYTKNNFIENWHQARIVPEMDNNGQVLFVLGILRDITEIKKTERALQQAQLDLERRVTERTKQLTIANLNLKQEIAYRKQTEDKLIFAKRQAEIANSAKTDFLANVSHELRTPMHHILNYSKFGMDKIEKPKEKLYHYFSQIRKTSQRLMFLLNELLDLSKLESGRMDYNMQQHDLSVIVADCVSEMGPMIEEKNVQLEIKNFADKPIVVCDGYKIGQVVQNLLSNAIKYTPAGKKIELSFGYGIIYSNKSPSIALKVSVADQGIGIPPGEIHQIFEKFVQSSKTKTGAGGTGLGLAISRRIIEDHKGRIWAAQNPDGGAIFSFLIPTQTDSQ